MKGFQNRNILLNSAFIIGWFFLLFNILTSPFKIDLKWVFIYLIVHTLVSASWGILLWIYLKIVKKSTVTLFDAYEFGKQKNDLKNITHSWKMPWFLITPYEDGLFLVTLFYTGINYFTVSVSSIFFALFHYPEYPIWACIPKGIGLFCIATFILPHSGILPLIVGHWIVDFIGLYIGPKILEMGGGTPFKIFYDNGTPKEEGLEINGKREGIVKSYYPNGQLSIESNYSKNKLNGIEKKYHLNGMLKSECFFMNDKREGEYKTFYENGNIKEIGFYKNGFIHGLSKRFNEDGILKDEKNYENGKVIVEGDRSKDRKEL